MFAFFGLGLPEIIILAIIGLTIFIIPVIAIMIGLSAAKQAKGAAPVSEIALLRAEVQQLREEIERLKRSLGGSGGATEITSLQ